MSRFSVYEDIYQRGKAANLMGVDRIDCPYYPIHEYARAWWLGWDYADYLKLNRCLNSSSKSQDAQSFSTP